MYSDYLVKFNLNDDKDECQTLVKADNEDRARMGAELKFPCDMVRILSVELVDESTDFGSCDECEYPLAKHCSSCESIYCEACSNN